MKLKIFLYFPVGWMVMFFYSCNSGLPDKTINTEKNASLNANQKLLKYAKRFSISENKLFKAVYLFGNLNIKDTTATYFFVKDSSWVPRKSKNTFVFKASCKKIASLSSLYTNMLCELGEINRIAAIENIDYYNNSSIINKHKEGNLAELSVNPEPDIEKTIELNPDIIFNFGMGNPGKGINKKIIQAKIPMALIVDHLEETPLARAEWIKFFAVFTNKSLKADSIFKVIEKNYVNLRHLAYNSKIQPSVFTEIKYGDVWYVPGGKSFAANFLRDANANYIWKEDTNAGSLHLSFEKVFSKAQNADFWLNLSLLNSKNELFTLENRYSEFKAFKNGELYNNNKVKNDKGYSTYWESGIMYPDKILSDLILIFHPELKTKLLEKGHSTDFNYYKKLE